MLRKEERSLRVRVLVPLTLTFLVLMGVFVYTGYNIRQDALHHALEHRQQGLQTLFDELQKQRYSLLAASLELIGNHSALQEAMEQQDRAALLKQSQPMLAELQSRHGITHLYFHNLDRTNLLRVHRPDIYGDHINRQTLKLAEQTRKLAHGMELGPLGTYTLRVVRPWYNSNRQLIGYMELGEEVGQTLQKLKAITNTDFLVTIDKNFLSRDAWQKGREMLGRYPEWNLFKTRALISQTLDAIPHSLEKKLFWDFQGGDHFHSAEAEARSYQDKVFPLFDMAGTNIGDFVMLLDVTDQQQNFIKFMLKTGAFALVVCSALFAFAYRILGHMDYALSRAREDLYGQIDRAEILNSKLVVEIADKKRAEEGLTSLNKTLEDRILDRTSELETLNEEIEAHRKELEKAYEDLKLNQTTILHQDKMASVGQLAAGVAHDINNPIGFVSNNLSELDQSIKDLCSFMELQCKVINKLQPDKEQLEQLNEKRNELHLDEMIEDLDDIIKESLDGTQRVSKIVQNLRKFSRVDEDDYELANIHECLDSTINISSNELRYKAEILRHYGDIPEIFCYPGQLNQVFMNLLINAAQSMHDYGQIEISTWHQEESVFISFKDTGSGMSEELKGRIFEPFFTTKDVGTGTGLGLSITYDIIQKHQGEIWVESEVGKGTTFVIRLPAKQQETG